MLVQLSSDPVIAEAATHVMNRALDPELRDDRYGPDAQSDAAVAWHDRDDPVGIAIATGASADGPTVVDLIIDTRNLDPTEGDVAMEAVRTVAEGDIELWARPTSRAAEAVAAGLGLVAHRSLHRMAMDLSSEPADPVPTRPFTDSDRDALRAVNNAAFAGHPDQGGWSVADLDAALAQPWVDPNGIRLYEHDAELKGFCWTKIHRYHDQPVGEIYVIALDPSVHGQGLGGPMTAAGIKWLYDQGIRRLMLYVEGTNAPAIAAYAALGMTTIATDRAWRGTIVGVSRD